MHDLKGISDLKWARETQQARGGKTQAALLNATEALILEGGPEAFSMQDVAKRAGSSIGSLYHHFKDKDALLNALFARMIEELERTYTEALSPIRWEGAGVIDILRGFTDVSFHPTADTTNPKLAGRMAVRSNPELIKKHDEQRVAFFEGLKALLLSRKQEIGHNDPEKAINVVLDILAPLWGAWQTEEERSTLSMRDQPDLLTNEIMAIVTQYLQVRNVA